MLRILPGLAALCSVACIDYDVHRERIREGWEQPAREGGVDILWIVDDSPTMYEEQLVLEDNADSFTTLLGMLADDFHLGVATTDMEAETAGLLVGEVITQDTADLHGVFHELVTVPTDGSRTEQGFAAALAVADPAGANADFARLGADLELVIMSDEDDQSQLAPIELIQGLQGQRPGRSVSVSAIVGDEPFGCFSVQAAADPGSSYIEAQQLSGGHRESICDRDFEGVLQRLSLQVLGLENRFYLSKVPAPDSLEVTVDGAFVHERAVDGWSYDPGDNSIVFDGWAVPPPGAGIGASYFEWLGLSEEEEEGDTAAR
jgi:hypothetical protein